ncbi:MMPL family transporter [Dactylosporangium darangshiense]|uniref:Membrane transport protein MMPL domain-containing protein n=1 Tax=Dactylosporangium darangshiense TaxID=579108 RepID=A0ABP8DQ21_9ACTN
MIAVALVGFGYAAAPDNDFSGGNSDSAKAQALIEKHFPERQGDTLTLAIKADKGIDDPAVRRKIEKVIADLDASPITGPITSPYQDSNLVAKDRHIARTTIPLTEEDAKKTEVKSLVDVVKQASGDGVSLGLGGNPGREGRDTRAGAGR